MQSSLLDGAGGVYRAVVRTGGTVGGLKKGAGVRDACRDIARGDVSINKRQSIEEARSLNLLTRFTELRNDW